LCYDPEEKTGKASDQKKEGGKHSKLNVTRVTYQLVARVEGNENNLVKKKKVELVDDMMSSRVFTVVQYDQQ